MKEAEIDSFLEIATVGRLGLSLNNQPYVVPLNFAYKKGHIYLHSAETGMMIDFLKNNSSVCFEVDEHFATISAPMVCEYDAAYRSVIAFGSARIVTDLKEKTATLRFIVAKYAGPEQAERITESMVDQYRSSLDSKTVTIDMAIERVTGKAWQPRES